MMKQIDMRDIPMYSVSSVSRLVGMTPGRVRRWLQGYEFSYSVREESVYRKQKPVVHRKGAADSAFASFLDLIDLLFVKGFLDHGLSLQKTRLALDEAESILGGHHFAQRDFFTDGHKIYLQVKQSNSADALLELLSGGQWVIAPIIKDLAKHIKFSRPSGFAERWYPLGVDKHVVVDPSICFGQPSVSGKQTATSNIYDFYLAENSDINRVCSWLELSREEANDAIDFEQYLLAA
jgi:uncharacterized protein (DUF433 family)